MNSTPTRPAPGGVSRCPPDRVRRPLRRHVPGGDEDPDHRPRGPDRLPAVPTEHHHRIRHSNFIERTFGETRRRAKFIGRFPGETSCISIVWAMLDRASRGWRGLTMTQPDCASFKTSVAACCTRRGNCDPTHLRARHPQHRSCQRHRVTSPTEARTCATDYTGIWTPPRDRGSAACVLRAAAPPIATAVALL